LISSARLALGEPLRAPEVEQTSGCECGDVVSEVGPNEADERAGDELPENPPHHVMVVLRD
jgi:hypothetical protein